MKKVISYRQKLFELARIYKINKILDKNLKHTTYEIEIMLLKNNVPIPSRRGYFAHKIINEIFTPFYESLEEKISIIKYFLNKNINGIFNFFYSRLKENFSINISFNKIFKKLLNIINNYFDFAIINITNFFKVLSKTIVENLNNVYNFKVKETFLNKIVVKAAYASVVIVLVFGGFYIKNVFTNLDSIKISLEIKSDKKENIKDLEKKVTVKTPDVIKKNESKNLVKKPEVKKKPKVTVKTPDVIKKNESKNLVKKPEVKKKPKVTVKTPDVIKKNESKNLVKKPEVKKKPYDPENDFNLNTETVLNLFEDLEYNLASVRNRKLVKPIYFTRLPKDLDTIKSVKTKKETFIQILLPLIVAENEKIEKDRNYLLKILKENESEKNKSWLNKKYKKYKVSKKNIQQLIEKIDIVPTSIAIAQAAKESGWGTSRFVLEGNAVFGQWTWNGVGIEPLDRKKEQKHKILKFPILRASVRAYINNLNTHRGYKSFRKKRAKLREQNKKLSGLVLIHELKNYAQTGKEYTKILKQIIEQNDLDDFETVTIDDHKKNNQLKL